MPKREVVLNFRLDRIQKALDGLEKIKTGLSKAKGLTADVRREISVSIKEQQGKLRELRAAELDRVRLTKRAKALAAQNVDMNRLEAFGENVAGPIAKFNAVRGALQGAFGAGRLESDFAAAGKVTQSFAPVIGGLIGGPLGAIVASLFGEMLGKALDAFEGRVRAQFEAFKQTVLIDVQEFIKQAPLSEFDRKLREDPEFAERVRRNAGLEIAAQRDEWAWADNVLSEAF